jgi:hypothetical protein
MATRVRANPKAVLIGDTGLCLPIAAAPRASVEIVDKECATAKEVGSAEVSARAWPEWFLGMRILVVSISTGFFTGYKLKATNAGKNHREAFAPKIRKSDQSPQRRQIKQCKLPRFQNKTSAEPISGSIGSLPINAGRPTYYTHRCNESWKYRAANEPPLRR